MKLSALLKPLIDAKVPHEIIMQQIIAFEEEQESALEKRRQSDAERQARKRERDAVSRDITLRHSDRSLVRDRDTRVDDKTSNLEIEPQKKEISPRAALASVLDDDRAKAVVEHRQRIRKPLTAHAASLLAKKFSQCPDPNAAADAMVSNGWQGFDPAWLSKPQSRAGPKPASVDPLNHFLNFASEIDGQERDGRSGGGDWDDAPGFPVRQIQHHG